VWRLLEDFEQLYDVGVRGKTAKGLDFSEIVDLFE
jgi:hypothetical protein